METLPLDPEQARSRDGLLAFLRGCQQRAVELGRGQLVSIATEAESLDPLAVLESIYEPQQLHFYVERRRDGLAIAGAEEAIRYCPEGTDRFCQASAWIGETLENTVAVGDPALPFFGPHFFCGFAFFGDSREAAPFPASTLFVPRWQVSVKSGRCVASANALVEASSDCEAIATRIWNAHAKFRSFDYRARAASARGGAKRNRLRVLHTVEREGEAGFASAVESALRSIEQGSFKKIVLARALDLTADQEFHPLEILNTLRERYADCYAFSVANGKGQSFIGASPERLARSSEGVLSVDALAGTAPRGATASEDAYFGGELLRSEKDLREHAIVFESIRRRLAQLGVAVKQACRPTLRKLQNVQHLSLEVQAELPDSVGLLDVVAALHPTPAVGGMPREAAVPRIADYERFDRGLYAGPIGWLNAQGEGEFLVGIRSALVEATKARLYAGVGIVAGSDPRKEFEETNLKLKALLENLL